MERKKTYIVKYRCRFQSDFTELENVVGDLKLDEYTKDHKGDPAPWPMSTRLLILEDDTRVEVDMEGTEFIFSPQRQRNLELDHNEEANQKTF